MPRKTNEGLSSRRGRVLADEDMIDLCVENAMKESDERFPEARIC